MASLEILAGKEGGPWLERAKASATVMSTFFGPDEPPRALARWRGWTSRNLTRARPPGLVELAKKFLHRLSEGPIRDLEPITSKVVFVLWPDLSIHRHRANELWEALSPRHLPTRIEPRPIAVYTAAELASSLPQGIASMYSETLPFDGYITAQFGNQRILFGLDFDDEGPKVGSLFLPCPDAAHIKSRSNFYEEDPSKRLTRLIGTAYALEQGRRIISHASDIMNPCWIEDKPIEVGILSRNLKKQPDKGKPEPQFQEVALSPRKTTPELEKFAQDKWYFELEKKPHRWNRLQMVGSTGIDILCIDIEEDDGTGASRIRAKVGAIVTNV